MADVDLDPDELPAAIAQGRVRAIEYHGRDLDVLAGTDLDYLTVVSPNADAHALNTMTDLRGVSLDSWVGDLRLHELPQLEWFGVVEAEKGQLDGLWDHGHPCLRLLSIGRYRQPSLAALTRIPQLTDLAIVDSRTLESLAGIETIPNLRRLELALCRSLGGLTGVEEAPGLESIVIESCHRIDDLGPLAHVGTLRSVQVDMRTMPALAALAGHPALEFAFLTGATVPKADIDALLTCPSLRMLQVRRSLWLRTGDAWQHIENVYAMTPDETDRWESLSEQFNRVKYGLP